MGDECVEKKKIRAIFDYFITEQEGADREGVLVNVILMFDYDTSAYDNYVRKREKYIARSVSKPGSKLMKPVRSEYNFGPILV